MNDRAAATLDFRAFFEAVAAPLLVITPPDWTIVAANQARLAITGTTLAEQLGRPLFDVFPDDPEDPDADGVRNLTASLERVLATGMADAMPVQRYSLRNAAGSFVERWWSPVNTPVLGEDGAVAFILHQVEEVTEAVLLRREADASARDVSAAKQAEQRALALVELGSLIRDNNDAADLAYAAAELLGRRLQVSRAGYGTIDKVAETITIERDWNAPGVRSLAGTLQFRDYGSYIEDLKQGRTVVFADAEKDPRTAATAEALKAISAQSVVNMPVTERGNFVALLYLNHHSARDWSDEELALVREVAERIRVATERLRVQTELRQSEARLRAVLDAAPIGLVFAEAPSGQITGGNAQAERIFGHSIMPSPSIEHYREWLSFHPDGRQVESHEYPLSRAIAGEAERPEMEVLYRRGDGRDVFLRLIASPVRDETGRIAGAVVASLDIDDERRAKQALERLNAELELRVEAATADLDRMWSISPDLLVVIDFEGFFHKVNPAWTTLLGYEPAELVGRHVNDFVLPDDAAITTDAYQTAAAGRALRVANRYRHKDGSTRWISWVAAPASGMTYANGRDVTAERQAEEELATVRESLRQAQKMEAVGQLTGGIAHDFNNMLAVVIGSLDLLRRRIGGEDARAKRYVDAAADGARRAALLTQRLLAFSRQQPLQPEPVDANKLVAGMSELIRGSLGSDIRLETVLASGLWRTHADPNQLENMLLNLAVNARDAMPDGGRLTIETQNAYLDARYVAVHLGVQAGQYVLLAVTDTGAGMPEDVKAKAFDPFFTTKAVGKGTGLGLSQVYGFVKQSGGHVKIYSEPGQGTTVKVYLPRLLGAEQGVADQANAAPLPLGDAQEVILLVEDEPAVRQFSLDALTELGYRVLEADGAAAALRLLESHPEIALMFTDVVMPDVNGRKLADEVRQRRPDLRVLFTTGYTRNAVVHNGVLDAGVQLIGKPFTVEELAAKVREVLDGPVTP